MRINQDYVDDDRIFPKASQRKAQDRFKAGSTTYTHTPTHTHTHTHLHICSHIRTRASPQVDRLEHEWNISSRWCVFMKKQHPLKPTYNCQEADMSSIIYTHSHTHTNIHTQFSSLSFKWMTSSLHSGEAANDPEWHQRWVLMTSNRYKGTLIKDSLKTNTQDVSELFTSSLRRLPWQHQGPATGDRRWRAWGVWREPSLWMI